MIIYDEECDDVFFEDPDDDYVDESESVYEDVGIEPLECDDE